VHPAWNLLEGEPQLTSLCLLVSDNIKVQENISWTGLQMWFRKLQNVMWWYTYMSV